MGVRTLKGAAVGLLAGLVFFKRGSSRRFCFYYGAGVGLGLSYGDMRHLYGKLTNEEKPGKPEEALEDLEKELRMRAKVSV